MNGLYAIIDPEHCLGRDPVWVAEQVLEGGCAALQLRAKVMPDGEHLALAKAVAERCRASGVPFWVNDRLDIALLVDADGLHVGQGDLPLAEVRRLFKGQLGLSTHDLDQARAAEADVIGFGPVFPTVSKRNPDSVVGLDALRAICAAVSLPVVAIGGVELSNAASVRESGASYAAAIGAICRAQDPALAARSLHAALRSAL